MSLLDTPTAGIPIPVGTGSCRTGHDWQVVAPWYRWERKDGLEPERAAGARRPHIQKYASTGFARDFIADPQRSIAFEPAVDMHFPLEKIPASERIRNGKVKILATSRRLAADSRKLFLPAHQRFYTVAIGVHCAEPGYPMVDPTKIREAGFVIRRHRAVVPDGEISTGFGLLQSFTAARAQAQVQLHLDAAKSRSRLLHPFGSSVRSRITGAPAATVDAAREVELARRRLHVWAAAAGVEHVTEAWVPTDDGSFGSWVPMPDQPEELIERAYKLRLLTPSPADPDHAALDGTIHWGVLPTSSDEVTTGGTARFNAFDLYDVRAYVRAECGDCPGPLVWSDPTEAFHLASFYDNDGCAQRPIDIQLPDFNQLSAAEALPSVKMTAPDGSSLKMGADGNASVGSGFEICFFSIPLITIIAMFVLNIFLPIVLLVFQLWWMLKLKFCIPPSVDFEADLALALDVEPPELELMADLDVDLLPSIDQNAVAQALGDIFSPPVDPAHAAAKQDDPDSLGTPWPLGDEIAAKLNNDPLVKLALRNGYGSGTDGAPDFTPAFTYTTSVRRDEVRHP